MAKKKIKQKKKAIVKKTKKSFYNRFIPKPIKKECAKCHKDIKEREHYFLIREFKDNKQIYEKFIHKNCPDELDDLFKTEIDEKDTSKELIEGEGSLNLFEQPAKQSAPELEEAMEMGVIS